jgi:hypothetical protein
MSVLTNIERAKYAEIIAWCEHMGSYAYYVEAEIERAIEMDAPSGVIYSTSIGQGRDWSSVYDMKNTALQAYILRRASEIRTNYANKIAHELGDSDLQNSCLNRPALQTA